MRLLVVIELGPCVERSLGPLGCWPVMALCDHENQAWRAAYGDDAAFNLKKAAILALGLPCWLQVVESHSDLQLLVHPEPGFVHLATGYGMVRSLLDDGRYHVSICRLAHHERPDAWWRVYERYHGKRVVLEVCRIRGGGSAVIGGHIGWDADLVALRAASSNWYASDPLRISM